MNNPTMDESPIIQRLKQRIAEKKRANEQTEEPEGTQGEQIDFYKFIDKEN